MKQAFKELLQRTGMFPMARSMFRHLDPAHRRERQLRHAFFAEFVRPDDLCFDVGANLGQTIEALRTCNAQVVALEPNPYCLPTLRYHFGADKQVVLLKQAVGSTSGVARLHFRSTASTASLREDWNPQDNQVIETELVTLAQLIATHGLPRLLKVDVEGFELEVFKGLDQPVEIIYFEMHGHESDTVEQILARLDSLGEVTGVNATDADHAKWLLPADLPWRQFLAAITPAPAVANVVVRMKPR